MLASLAAAQGDLHLYTKKQVSWYIGFLYALVSISSMLPCV